MAIDADLIHTCADPSLKPAIVEKFIRAAGSPDPLTVTVRSGNRVVLVPPPKTPENALDLARKYVGQAVVRVGVTQYPAGLGVSDPSEVSPDLFDACKNLKIGTGLFGKVWRIVWKWYGNPTDESVMPQVLDDAVEAWKTGYFEGTGVFSSPDPGEPKATDRKPEVAQQPAAVAPVEADTPRRVNPVMEQPIGDPNTASTRIDLSGIGGRTP